MPVCVCIVVYRPSLVSAALVLPVMFVNNCVQLRERLSPVKTGYSL